jgi:hypothetical protein
MTAARLPTAIASALALGAVVASCAPTPVRPVDAADGGAPADAAVASAIDAAPTKPDVGTGTLPDLDAGTPVVDSGLVIDAGAPVDAGPMPDGGRTSDVTTCASGAIAFTSTANGGVTARTTHYEVATDTDVATAEELARLLEAAYGSLRYAFGDDPAQNGAGPLRVRVYRTSSALATALAASDGGAPSAPGGAYDSSRKTVLVALQSTRFATRAVLLREAARQFQQLQARFANPRMPSWYAEGLVESLARHDWDGNCVRLGVSPLLTADDFPRAALAETTAASFRLAPLIGSASADAGAADGGALTATRPMSLAIVRFLQQTDRNEWRGGFASYGPRIEASSLVDFNAVVGDPAAMQSPLIAFLQSQQEPFAIVGEDWEHVAPNAFFGVAASSRLGAAILKRTGPTQLDVTVRPDAPANFSAGVVTSFRDPTSFTAVLVSGNGVVAEARLEGNSVAFTSLGDATALVAGAARISARYTPTTATVSVNGTSFVRSLSAPSRVGFVVWGSRARFGDIAYR